jgi:transposase-like protein
LRKGTSEVVKKKRTIKKFRKAFREDGLERLRSCENVTARAEELGVHRTLRYKWRERMQAGEKRLPDNPHPVEFTTPIAASNMLLANTLGF